MHYEEVLKLDDEKFRRLTGLKRHTFEKMSDILSETDQKIKKRGGRKSKLSIEGRLLMTLEYLREYRTYFHIGHRYGVSESSAYKIVKWVEDTLIKHPDFSLPGKKELLKNEVAIVLMDVTETPIERPKKSKKSTILERKSNTHTKLR